MLTFLPAVISGNLREPTVAITEWNLQQHSWQRDTFGITSIQNVSRSGVQSHIRAGNAEEPHGVHGNI